MSERSHRQELTRRQQVLSLLLWKFRAAVAAVAVCQLLGPVALLHLALAVQVLMLKLISHPDFLACLLQSVQVVQLAHQVVEMVARAGLQVLDLLLFVLVGTVGYQQER